MHTTTGHRQWVSDDLHAVNLHTSRGVVGVPLRSTAGSVLWPTTDPGQTDDGSQGSDAVNPLARKSFRLASAAGGR